MDNIKKYSELICGPRYKKEAAVDVNHSFLLFGVITSLKPENVLEIGVGTGFISKTILYALKYNQKGTLNCVDSMSDYVTPQIINEVKALGANFTHSSEEDFVKNCEPGKYDLLVSDGDHRNAHKWKAEVFKLVKPCGFLFFHDINTCPRSSAKGEGATWQLYQYLDYVIEHNFPYFLFDNSSRSGERCERGWLMVINKRLPGRGGLTPKNWT